MIDEKRKISITTIIGARPQFVKAATVSRVIHELNANKGQQSVYERIIHTGQHYDRDMSDVWFE